MPDAHLDLDVATANAARGHLGPAFERLQAYAGLLAAEGVLRGLIGPREVPRIWERHLLNSAALHPFLPRAGVVIDVGSGAGLPGVVIACLRPEQPVILVEPMERRATWLREVAAALDLPSVEVRRARAEELHGVLSGAAVTARAVAPLNRLVRWCLPLVERGGVLLALKGSRAVEEIGPAADDVSRLGGAAAEVIVADAVPGAGATTVVRIRRTSTPPTRARQGRR